MWLADFHGYFQGVGREAAPPTRSGSTGAEKEEENDPTAAPSPTALKRWIFAKYLVMSTVKMIHARISPVVGRWVTDVRRCTTRLLDRYN